MCKYYYMFLCYFLLLLCLMSFNSSVRQKNLERKRKVSFFLQLGDEDGVKFTGWTPPTPSLLLLKDPGTFDKSRRWEFVSNPSPGSLPAGYVENKMVRVLFPFSQFRLAREKICRASSQSKQLLGTLVAHSWSVALLLLRNGSYFSLSLPIVSFQSSVSTGRTDAEAETPILWPLHVKSWLTGRDPDAGRDWGQEETGTTEDETAGWHHRLDGHGSGWTPGVGGGQGGLACCGSRGKKESDTTEWLSWAELKWLCHLA